MPGASRPLVATGSCSTWLSAGGRSRPSRTCAAPRRARGLLPSLPASAAPQLVSAGRPERVAIRRVHNGRTASRRNRERCCPTTELVQPPGLQQLSRNRAGTEQYGVDNRLAMQRKKPHEQARSLGVLKQVRTHGSKLEMSRSTIRICSNGYTATVLQPCCNRSSTGPNSTGFASELECRKPLS